MVGARPAGSAGRRRGADAATDLFFAFPPLVLAMAVSAALGPSLQNAVIAAIIVWWPTYARLVRAEVLRVDENLYVEAGRALGLTTAGSWSATSCRRPGAC